jgi:hypothetical protein
VVGTLTMNMHWRVTKQVTLRTGSIHFHTRTTAWTLALPLETLLDPTAPPTYAA